MSPLHPKNNIQGEGPEDFNEVQTVKYPKLLARQQAFVRRITEEVNSFDNIILEICDEPIVYGTSRELAGPWLRRLVETAAQTESKLPKSTCSANRCRARSVGRSISR